MMLIESVAFSCLIILAKALDEGDDCVIQQTSQKGKCISISECEYAKKLLISKRTPQNCGFNIQLPLVCCPLPKSVKMCNEYHDKRNQVFAAFNGAPARPKEFPHMVAVGYGDKNNILWLCGGTLISKEFVLTAAHCIYSKDFGVVKWVRLGDLDLQNKTEEADPQDFSVTRFIVHPDYNPSLYYHDIALLQFEGIIAFNIFYKPACLNTDEILPNNNVQATGWGQTGYAEDPSSHLIKVNLTIVEHQKCQEFYSRVSKRRLPHGILEQFQLCAGDDSGNSRDTCPGDSGGPLHYYKKSDSPQIVDHYVVAGITSFGKICGLGNTTAGVYTKVSAYTDWVENIVWPDN